MTGATSTTNGVAGYAPRPLATDYAKFLRGDGTWQFAGAGGDGPLLTPITITDYSIPSGYNAAFIDNVTITGTITVPSGSTLVILNGTAP